MPVRSQNVLCIARFQDIGGDQRTGWMLLSLRSSLVRRGSEASAWAPWPPILLNARASDFRPVREERALAPSGPKQLQPRSGSFNSLSDAKGHTGPGPSASPAAGPVELHARQERQRGERPEAAVADRIPTDVQRAQRSHNVSRLVTALAMHEAERGGASWVRSVSWPMRLSASGGRAAVQASGLFMYRESSGETRRREAQRSAPARSIATRR